MYDKMQDHDKKMATDLVDALLAKGCLLTVHDGEDFACQLCDDRAKILDGMGNTDTDEVTVRDVQGYRMGWFRLVYGNNPGETINDYTCNDFCDGVMCAIVAINPIFGD